METTVTTTTGLREVLLWVISGGGAGALTFWLMEKTRLAELPPRQKRILSLVLAVALACGAWGLAVALAYLPMPATAQAWAEALFAVAFPAVLVSQGAHGILRLSGDKEG